jgi:isopentenyldiphosphate isomerase
MSSTERLFRCGGKRRRRSLESPHRRVTDDLWSSARQEIAISYEERIAECNNADLSRFMPWRIGLRRAGFVRRDRAPMLRSSGRGFSTGRDGVIELLGDSPDARTANLEELARELARRGEIRMRGERFPVTDAFEQPNDCEIDRGLVPWLGVRPFGVHLCAFTRRRDGLCCWVAVRAADKSFPGAWDNTVAGGQPAGLSLLDNVVKECAEEASIPATIARRAAPVGKITYVREDATGLKPDTLFCYDLELTDDFEPAPHDGEVERFLCVPVAELARIVRDEPRCKPNCALVWIDFLLRHGALDDQGPSMRRDALRRSLSAPLP